VEDDWYEADSADMGLPEGLSWAKLFDQHATDLPKHWGCSNVKKTWTKAYVSKSPAGATQAISACAAIRILHKVIVRVDLVTERRFGQFIKSVLHFWLGDSCDGLGCIMFPYPITLIINAEAQHWKWGYSVHRPQHFHNNKCF
jgi:hypothetical protein